MSSDGLNRGNRRDRREERVSLKMLAWLSRSL